MEKIEDHPDIEQIVNAMKETYYVHNGGMYRNDTKDILGFREIARIVLERLNNDDQR